MAIKRGARMKDTEDVGSRESYFVPKRGQWVVTQKESYSIVEWVLLNRDPRRRNTFITITVNQPSGAHESPVTASAPH